MFMPLPPVLRLESGFLAFGAGPKLAFAREPVNADAWTCPRRPERSRWRVKTHPSDAGR
jgi:hypothetical protein